MKRLLACVLLVSLVSACNANVDYEPMTVTGPSSTVNRLPPTITASPPTETPTFLPIETSTLTPIPCDPSATYCIEDGHFFLERPIALPGTVTIDPGYPYGSTEGGKRDPHHGVEFYNASGTPVLAAADGLVVVAGDDSQIVYGPLVNFYGNLIVLEHHFPGINQPVFTLYGHLSKVDVQVGQSVQSGDKIGEVGSTGYATGSHLHFEVRLGKNDYDSNRNPVLWLKPLSGNNGISFGVIAGRLADAQEKLIHASNVNIQYFPDLNGPQAAAYQLETYAPEQNPVNGDNDWDENFTMSDLPAGNYRISLVWGGKLYDRRIVVMPGKITFVVFQIDQ